jgi:hypothetical protein
MKLLLLVAGLASSLSATTFYVTVAGLGGEADYEQRFNGLASDLERLFSQSGDARVLTLRGPEATRERLGAVLAEVAAQARPEDAVVLLLIGHGSFDGEQYKVNLPGPDVPAEQLAQMLDRIRATRQLVAVLTSSSGAALPLLQRPGRAVITATRSGTEKNAVVFARYWVAALQDPAADTDKNEVITALEAFLYADRKTVDFYATQKRLATEHALLEDTGSGEGVRLPSPENGRGLLAGQFPLLRIGAAQRALQDPAKRELLARKEQLEQQIDKLKYEKAAMPTAEYRKQLTALLLELAKTQEALER